MSNIVPMGDIERMAQAVAKSGLFGVKTVDAAVALMLIAQAEGRHPALAARDYDIIQGRPAKKSEAMLRDFLESGGKVEWHGLDDTVADATFSHPSGGTVRIVWDMKRAVAAGLGGRDMWKKYPRQMLRSRTVSEGIRTVCPMATSGMYVPEEVQDIVKEKDITPKAGADERVTPEQQERIKGVVDKVTEWLNRGAVADAVMETENADMDADESVYFWTFFDSKQRAAMKVERKRQMDERKAKELPPAENVQPDVISAAQHKRLEARISELGVNRDAAKAYCKRMFGKEHFTELTKEEYDILDVDLPSLAQKEPAAPQQSPSVATEDSPQGASVPATAAAQDGLINREQIQEIETLLDMKGIDKKRFLMIAKVKSVDEIRAERFAGAISWLDRQK